MEKLAQDWLPSFVQSQFSYDIQGYYLLFKQTTAKYNR